MVIYATHDRENTGPNPIRETLLKLSTKFLLAVFK
jgi:hypothetical protein